MQTNQKISTWKRGITLTKSSWHILKAEKNLFAIEALYSLAMIATLALIIVVFVASGMAATIFSNSSAPSITIFGFITLMIGYLIYGFVYSYFAGVFIHMVYARLSGSKTSIAESFRAANKRLPQLLAFGAINVIIGVIIDEAQSRLPFAGKILAFLGSVAWTVATIFAIPVIVTSKEKVGPIKAVKESASIIRKTWGEGVISQLGIGLVALLSVFAFVLTVTAIGTLAYTIQLSGVTVVLAVLGVLGVLVISFVFSMLSSIAQSALFYYAQTGKEPEQFDKELLKSVMTPKKARKIFA